MPPVSHGRSFPPLGRFINRYPFINGGDMNPAIRRTTKLVSANTSTKQYHSPNTNKILPLAAGERFRPLAAPLHVCKANTSYYEVILHTPQGVFHLSQGKLHSPDSHAGCRISLQSTNNAVVLGRTRSTFTVSAMLHTSSEFIMADTATANTHNTL